MVALSRVSRFKQFKTFQLYLNCCSSIVSFSGLSFFLKVTFTFYCYPQKSVVASNFPSSELSLKRMKLISFLYRDGDLHVHFLKFDFEKKKFIIFNQCCRAKCMKSLLGNFCLRILKFFILIHFSDFLHQFLQYSEFLSNKSHKLVHVFQ